MFPPFLKTPCGRLAKESSPALGSMPLWRPAFPGSFREESDYDQVPPQQDSWVIFA